MKTFFKYHLLSILTALFLCICCFFIVLKYKLFVKENLKTTIIKGEKNSQQGFLANLLAGDSSEIDFVGSLKEKNGITLLGSSEITGDFQFMPNRFLPQQFGIRVNSYGHAYQQCFAIYTQLLALKKELKDSKICIILSPGWFEQGGTNIEAFLEFARPNFLRKIIKDETISIEDKEYIGAFIEGNYENIENPSKELNFFYNIFKYKDIFLLNSFFQAKSLEIENVEYQVKTTVSKKIPKINYNWDSLIEIYRTKFIHSIKSNKKFIVDSYFLEYIKQKDGSIMTTEFLKRDVSNNQELKDFKKLVQLLKDNNVDASFVLQQLNPFHYKKLSSFDHFAHEIDMTLKKNKFPFLNKFESDKAKFEPAVLNDIMHFGEVGWLEIDKFLLKNYSND